MSEQLFKFEGRFMTLATIERIRKERGETVEVEIPAKTIEEQEEEELKKLMEEEETLKKEAEGGDKKIDDILE